MNRKMRVVGIILIVLMSFVSNSRVMAWSVCDICDCSQSIVDCRNRNISQFENSLELPELFITLDISDNKLFSLEPSTFTSVPQSLINIDVSGNKFETMTSSTFASFSELRNINLSNNLLSVIAGDAFLNQSTLHELNLSFNRIDKLLPHTFSSLNNLKFLDLSFNLLTTLGEFTLKNLINLKTLDLSFLQLHSIHPAAFDWNLTIENLHLSHNYLKKVPTQSLWFLRNSLVNLEFSGNLIEAIEADAFMGLYKLESLKLEQLLHLKKIHDYAFQDLQSLEKVVFRYLPKIREFESKAFHLKKVFTNETGAKCPIRDFTFEFTILTVISQGLLDWDRLRYLSFKNNRWYCDCKLTWMKETNIKLSSKTIYCSGPPQNDGRRLFEVDNKGLTCSFQMQSRSGIGIVVLVFAIGLFISFVTVAVLVYRHNGWIVRPPRINYDRINSTTANTITIFDQSDIIELANQSAQRQMTIVEGT